MKTLRVIGATLAIFSGLQFAQAADLPARAPYYKAPVMVTDVWSWTGFYIGGNGGYSWGHSDTDGALSNSLTGAAILGGTTKFKMNGAVAGGQIGFNWQSGRWVWGLEADGQWTDQKGSVAFFCPAGVCTGVFVGGAAGVGNAVNLTLSQRLEWFGTARGRLGWTLTPTVLLYGTGGLAYGEIDTTGSITNATGTLTTLISNNKTRLGWTAGGGIEARLWGNWTGKIEYLYVDLGDVSGGPFVSGIPIAPAGSGAFISGSYSSRITDHIVRAGLNYKFDWGAPITARY